MKKKVYAYIHTHWDREWYREFEEFRIRLIEVFEDVLQKLHSGTLDCFYFDGQTAALEDFLEIYPERKCEVEKLIAQKKLYIGPYYCSTDSLLVDRESLIRNLQYGINYSRHFGCKDFIAYHADTFGHSKDMPKIVNYFNIDYGIFWRGCGCNPSEFNFNGLNTTYLIEGYFHDELSQNVSYDQKASGIKRTLDRIAKYSSANLLLPLGADHLAAAENIKEQIAQVNKYLDDYEIVLYEPFEYFEQVRDNFKKYVSDEQRSRERNFILPGVYSSRIDLKQKNTKAQWLLTKKIEPLQALTSYLSRTRNYQREIDYAYKMLMKNHAHDSIYGCSTDAVHRENNIRYEKIFQTAHAIEKSVFRDIKGDNLTVFNFSDTDFSGAIKFYSEKNLKDFQLIGVQKGFPDEKLYPVDKSPVTEDVCDIYEYLVDVKNIPAFSATKLEGKFLQKNSDLRVTESSVENENIKIYLKNKKICAVDKKQNKEYKNFIDIIDRADIGDSYNFGALKKDREIKAKILKSEVFEKGFSRCILKLTAEIDIPKTSNNKGRSKKTLRHKLNIFVSIENGSNFAEIKTDWVNKSENHILQFKFNFENKITETISDDLISEVIREFDPNYDIYKYIPAPRGIELKYNTAPLQKYVCANNAGIITEGLQEYEIYKNAIMLTVLRSTGTISNPENPTRGTPAGPPLDTPELQMKGAMSVRFAVLFDTKKMKKSVDKFFGKTFAEFSDFQNIQFAKAKGFEISAIKSDEKNNLILRFVNPSKAPRIFDFSTELPYSKIVYLNAMEEEISDYEKKEIAPESFVAIKIKK